MSVTVTASPTDVRAILDSIGWPELPGAAAVDAQAELESVLHEERPDTLLSTMLGLDGAVSLGDQIDRAGDLQPGPRSDVELALHNQILQTLVKRRALVRSRVERRYAQAFEGLRPVPNEEAIMTLLNEQGALLDRSPGVLAACAQKIGNRYRFLFASTMGVVRKEIYWLREDLLRSFQHASAPAQELLALDRVLEAAMEQATVRAHRGLEAGVAERFAGQLIEALLQLPEDEAKARSAVDAWFKRRGFIARFLHDCRRLTWALLDQEWSRLRALLFACCGPQTDEERVRAETLYAQSAMTDAQAPVAHAEENP